MRRDGGLASRAMDDAGLERSVAAELEVIVRPA